MKKLFLLLLLPCVALANEVHQICGDTDAKVAITMQDKNLSRNSSVEVPYSHDITINHNICKHYWHVVVYRTMCVDKRCHEEIAEGSALPGAPYELHEKGVLPALYFGNPGVYQATYRISIPAWGCDLTAKSTVTVL